MKGLELARNFYNKTGKKLIEDTCPELIGRAAFGLVGEGSECFGYDDELSKDHDLGEDYCIWLNDEDYQKYGHILKENYKALERNSDFSTLITDHREGRVGVLSISGFYRKYTGLDRLPQNSKEWLAIPEDYLATVTNGQVFFDPLGEFSRIREGLLAFYPCEVVKKKLCAYLLDCSQTGQYNLPRLYKRLDGPSFALAKGIFLEAVFHVLFLLEKSYLPYYKWRFKALEDTSYPKELIEDLKFIAVNNMSEENMAKIDKVCLYISDLLRYYDFTGSQSTYLEDLAYEIYASINDEYLKDLHILYGGLR